AGAVGIKLVIQRVVQDVAVHCQQLVPGAKAQGRRIRAGGHRVDLHGHGCRLLSEKQMSVPLRPGGGYSRKGACGACPEAAAVRGAHGAEPPAAAQKNRGTSPYNAKKGKAWYALPFCHTSMLPPSKMQISPS